MSRLEAVRSQEVDEPAQERHTQPAPSAAAITNQVATKMLLIAIGALGQRALVAAASIFTLLTAASAFYLWMIALPEIDTPKIIALTIYSLFVLALNIYGRRK